jgi:hypothetical protein
MAAIIQTFIDVVGVANRRLYIRRWENRGGRPTALFEESAYLFDTSEPPFPDPVDGPHGSVYQFPSRSLEGSAFCNTPSNSPDLVSRLQARISELEKEVDRLQADAKSNFFGASLPAPPRTPSRKAAAGSRSTKTPFASTPARNPETPAANGMSISSVRIPHPQPPALFPHTTVAASLCAQVKMAVQASLERHQCQGMWPLVEPILDASSSVGDWCQGIEALMLPVEVRKDLVIAILLSDRRQISE